MASGRLPLEKSRAPRDRRPRTSILGAFKPNPWSVLQSYFNQELATRKAIE
jgi:hypothetical protein